MRAALLTEIPAAGLELVDIAGPTPGPGEVLIEVAACGICGTDLHIMDGASYRPSLPFLLGHEPVGIVRATGRGADPSLRGRRIAPTLFVGDGTCDYCLAGDERLCSGLIGIIGVQSIPGGFAELLAFPAGQAVEIPSGLGDIEAASLVDGGATAANSVRELELLTVGSPASVRSALVVVIGAGPIGLLVAELVGRLGRPHVLVQPSQLRRMVAQAMGHDVVADLADVNQPVGVVIDCAGTIEALPWAIANLRPMGVFIAAGYGLTAPLNTAGIARKELKVTGVRSGRREDLESIFLAASEGRIQLPPVSTRPLSKINDALDDLRSHVVPGKMVVVPGLARG